MHTSIFLLTLVLAPAPPGPTIFRGMCDASGAIALDARSFAVVDDEDNLVRVYDVERGGAPLRAYDLDPIVHLPAPAKTPGKVPKPRARPKKSPEMDLEAATTLGDTAYWLTSHGLNSKGKRKDSRFVFFATSIPRDGKSPVLVGQPYLSLLDDLLDAASLHKFALRAAAQRAPKAQGGLNLEGLTATADGKLLIGLRNPIPEGRALAVSLLNPAEVMRGQRAQLGPPIQLDLGGHGIRALSWWRGQYLILSGNYGSGGTPHLHTWDGTSAPRRLPIDLSGLNPEGFFTPENRDDIVVLSDDGSLSIDGTPCKELKDPTTRRFRGLRVPITPVTKR